MNFKQAIEEMKKGKKVRRKGWKDVWFTLDNGGALLRSVPGHYNKKATITGLEPLTLESVENVYANDWEVVEEKKDWWEPELDEEYYIICVDGSIDCNNYDCDWNDVNQPKYYLVMFQSDKTIAVFLHLSGVIPHLISILQVKR